jgi:Ca2+:H+ antiporter
MDVKRLFAAENLLNWLLVFVPITAWLHFTHAGAVPVFVCACLGLLPLAGWMGRATEHLSTHVGEGVGGLLNGTLGNAAEFIIAFMALREGHVEVVKASITGSIIGNILLVFGLAALAGGLKRGAVKFNAQGASTSSTLLFLSAMALVVPSIFHGVVGADHETSERGLSFDISLVLLAVYALSMVFVLKTHSHLYVGGEHHAGDHGAAWSKGKAIGVLVAATVGVAWMAEMLVHSLDGVAKQWGMNEVFLGVILVAVVGNAAEHSTAILAAMKGRGDLAINIAVGSSIQVALLVAPALVLLSYAVAPVPMDLLFSPLEVLAAAASVAGIAMIAHDGEANWLEGILLLAVYCILGMAFWFLPGKAA